jgi:hypothetical protein
VRKWKRPKEFGAAEWEFEIGENSKSFNPDTDLMAPSGSNVSYPLYPKLYLAYLYKKRYS